MESNPKITFNPNATECDDPNFMKTLKKVNPLLWKILEKQRLGIKPKTTRRTWRKHER